MKGIGAKFTRMLLLCALAAAVAPNQQAYGYHRHKDVELTEDDYDPGYAYCASAYVPSVRPQVILITVAVLGAIAVYYMSRQDSHHHHVH